MTQLIHQELVLGVGIMWSYNSEAIIARTIMIQDQTHHCHKINAVITHPLPHHRGAHTGYCATAETNKPDGFNTWINNTPINLIDFLESLICSRITVYLPHNIHFKHMFNSLNSSFSSVDHIILFVIILIHIFQLCASLGRVFVHITRVGRCHPYFSTEMWDCCV